MSHSAVLIGDEGLLTLCGDLMLEQGWTILGVVSAGNTVNTWARQNGLTTVERHETLIDTVLERPEYIFSITNFRVIPPSIIDWATQDAFNFHDGPLPVSGGLNTPSWAILRGEKSHGISWHRMTGAVDGGEVVYRANFPISETDTVLELNAQCFEHGFEGFKYITRHLPDRLPALGTAQRPERFYRRADKPLSFGFIDWADSTDQIVNLYRATEYGPYRNAFATAKVFLGSDHAIVSRLVAVTAELPVVPGQITDKGPDYWIVGTGDGAVRVELTPTTIHDSRRPGERLPALPGDWIFSTDEGADRLTFDDLGWQTPIQQSPLLSLQHVASPEQPDKSLAPLFSGEGYSAESALAAVACLLGRMNDTESVGLQLSNTRLLELHASTGRYLLPYIPCSLDIGSTVSHLLDTAISALELGRHCSPIPVDLFTRMPDLSGKEAEYLSPNCVFVVVDCISEVALVDEDVDFCFVFCVSEKALHLRSGLNPLSLTALQQTFSAIQSFIAEGGSLERFECLSEHDIRLLNSISAGPIMDFTTTTVDRVIEARAMQASNSQYLYWQGRKLGLRELCASADQVCAFLVSSGISPGANIGVMLRDRIDATAAMLGIWKAGMAYVPLDPSYPLERLQYIAEDAAVAYIFSESDSLGVAPCNDLGSLPEAPAIADSAARPEECAYVIFTSGSTGKPKGVQVTHDNVINFLQAMDRVIDSHEGTMLSVTSISFDISVLEIWWSLSRGLNVVFYDPQDTLGDPDSSANIDFSLYFWNTQAADAPSTVPQTYQFVESAAKFGDDHGFHAVWVPERHFGSFGGAFPNPAITATTIAACTKNIRIRAGSCVLPLHHPIRVAEDWSMIDNLSGGRVGISFASGWMPIDFAIAPQNYAEAKEVMFTGIDQVRRLWRGEHVVFDTPLGEKEILTLPRPVQRDLPAWLTTAGNPESFAQAGRNGLNILTHLLGQSFDELAEKIRVYRTAWREAGHAGEGHVTLMLHTFVTDSSAKAESISREPMKNYLRSAMKLIEAAAWDFPTFKRMNAEEKLDVGTFVSRLSDEDLDDLLEFAFQRYFRESGLFGTPEENIHKVEHYSSAGIDEIGCLIDFGVAPDIVLSNLKHLVHLKNQSRISSSNTLSELVEHFEITHLQCTPSQAKLFHMDPENHQGLSKIGNLLVGGEPLSQSLADALGKLVEGKVTNMYGPTETTVWSLTSPIDESKPVRIGTPILNTTVHILDSGKRRVPVGWAGELHIGGRGVSRGYLNRPDLTAEKFFDLSGERVYATGDIVRVDGDGQLEFLGRIDHQVKVRGFRIELGEIQTILETCEDVAEAHVVGEEDQWGDQQIAAYYRSTGSTTSRDLRAHLAKQLPDYMIPARFIQVTAFPRTLNGKLDVTNITLASKVDQPQAAPLVSTTPNIVGARNSQNELKQIWQQLLQLDEIDTRANFFDLGGHSILAIRLQGILSEKYGRKIMIADIFRYPTIESMAGLLELDERANDRSLVANATSEATSRGARRRNRFRK